MRSTAILRLVPAGRRIAVGRQGPSVYAGCGQALSPRVGTAGGVWGDNWTCYSGWADYAQRNGIVCDPGTVIKGGDGILYECQ